MNESEVSSQCSRLESLRQRLLDTASYLRGIAAIVESLNKGAADQMEVAINAVQAVGDDLTATVDEYPDVRAAFDDESTQPVEPVDAATAAERAIVAEEHTADIRYQLKDVTSRLIELLAARKVGRGGQVSMQTAIRELKGIGASLDSIQYRAYVEPIDSRKHADHGFTDRNAGHSASDGAPNA